MSITVNLYTFAKKVNSTGRPSTSPLTLDCVLKDSCSIIYPVIGIDRGITWNPSSYNYAQISAFHRYYYVNDWSFAEGLWWAALSVDALATWKDSILSSTAYVSRASKQYDGSIGDVLYPAECKYENAINSYWQSDGQTPWRSDFNSGFYVVGIVNNDSQSIGAVSYYAFTPLEFANFKALVLTDTTWTGIATTNPDIGDNLYRSLFNPIQYISSVNWFPLLYEASLGPAITSLNFGWWTINNVSCRRLSSYSVTLSSALNVPAHPQAVYRGMYLNSSPFSKYRLFAPPFGEFELDGSLLYDNLYNASHITTINCYIHVDLISGNGSLTVITNASTPGNEGKTMLLAQALVAVPIQIAQITSDHMGELRNLVNTTSGIISSAFHADVGGAISTAANGVLNAIEMSVQHPMTAGNNGSLVIYWQKFRLECLYYVMVQDAVQERGRPLCQERTLSELSPGYIQTVGSHIPIAGSEQEISAVNTALDGGVFLE